jgi:hypothetical protein
MLKVGVVSAFWIGEAWARAARAAHIMWFVRIAGEQVMMMRDVKWKIGREWDVGKQEV